MPKDTDGGELYPSDSSFMKDMQLLKNLQALKTSIEPKLIIWENKLRRDNNIIFEFW